MKWQYAKQLKKNHPRIECGTLIAKKSAYADVEDPHLRVNPTIHRPNGYIQPGELNDYCNN